MNRSASKRLRAHDSRRDPDDAQANAATETVLGHEERSAVGVRLPAQQRRMLELEQQLANALAALARQQGESEENATSFSQAMARLSHSERTLGQTKAKLMDVEERLQRSEAHGATLTQQLNLQEEEITRLEHELESAQVREFEQNQSLKTLRVENETKARELEAAHESTSRVLEQEKGLRELAESLSRDSAEGAAECARLNEDLKAAAEREQRALGRALNAEAELSEQHAELKRACDAALSGLASSRITIAELEAERALAQQEIASADHERARFIDILSALEVLGREIVAVGSHARQAAEARAKVEPEAAESQRVTLKPAPAAELAAKRLRSSAAPEITVDGVLLDT
jgi:chromosome segregation ATPase